LKRGSFERDHVIHFVIRDHYSGFFYAETHPLSKMISLEGFLHHAWATKKNYPFFGLPRSLMIQQHILEFFPTIKNFLGNTSGLHAQLSSSGFEAGIASVKHWEQQFLHQVQTFENGDIPYSRLLNKFILLNSQLYRYSYSSDESLLEKYVSGMHLTPKEYACPSVTADFEEFSDLFNSTDLPKYSNGLVEAIYHMDLEKEITEQPDFSKIEYQCPRRDYLSKVDEKGEIKSRPGYRSIFRRFNDTYYVLYKAEEFGIKQPPQPWVLICEKHGTQAFHRVIGEALAAGRDTSRTFWCDQCRSEYEERMTQARER
jgi:hypothetical protein